MKFANILRMLTYISMFVSIYMATSSIADNNPDKGIREFLTIGVIPTSLMAAIRHMFLSGSIMKGGRFFEFECGGANLGIAVASLLAFLNNMNNQTIGIIFLIYAIYLFIGSIAWLKFTPKGNILLWLAKFWSMTLTLSYFSYVALK